MVKYTRELPQHISSIARTAYIELCIKMIDTAYQLQRYIVANSEECGPVSLLIEDQARKDLRKIIEMINLMENKYVKPLIDKYSIE